MQAQNKTVPTSADVLHFLANFDDDQRKDSETLVALMQKVSGKPPVMWGPSIIGFGQYHYKYASGREGDAPAIGFSPRKGKMVLYITDDATKYQDITSRLGKHKTSKACVYINKLSDVDLGALEDLITAVYDDTTRMF